MIDEKNFMEFMTALEEAGAEHVSFDDLRKFIDEQPKIGEWILCSERLPIGEEYEFFDKEEEITLYAHVLVLTSDPNIPQTVAFYDTDSWFEASTLADLNVIAWQPLPKPCIEINGEGI